MMDIAKLLIPKQESVKQTNTKTLERKLLLTSDECRTMTPPRDEAARLVSLPSLTSEAHPPRRRVTLVRSKQQAPPSPAQRHPTLDRIRKPISRPKRRVILMRTQQHRGRVSEPPCSPPKRRVIIVRGQAAAAAAAVTSARKHAETEVPVKFAAAAQWLQVAEGKATCTESAVVVNAGRENPGNAREEASRPSVTTRSGRISRPPTRFVP
ncbi:hypothetical protein NHJ13734_001969 [Beauveria thailandica]